MTQQRRLKVFNTCKAELDLIKAKRSRSLLQGGKIARMTLRIMLGVYWRDFFRKLKRRRTNQTFAEDLKQSEAEAREAVLTRLVGMTQYVDSLEELIGLNPICRVKLVDETTAEMR